MPDIKHLGYGSLAIQLTKEKQIVLGPRETVDVSLDELNSESIQQSLREGFIAILPGEAQGDKKLKPKTNPS